MLMHATPIDPGARARHFYVDALRELDRAGARYAVGGGYALAYYTGIQRNTKDLDIFVKPEDHRQVLQVLSDAGYRTEYFYPFWIAKALSGPDFIDILYNSGNGQARVDDEWFTHGVRAEVLGYETLLIPPEELVWSKGFVMDRDRYDGADIHHVFLSLGDRLDWDRLIRRFKGHERVLLAHAVLFGYAYPSERGQIPAAVLDRLLGHLGEAAPTAERVCFGSNLAHRSYLHPIHAWGYADGRIKPHGPLALEDVAQFPEH